MVDITSITGKALIDKTVMKRILATVEETPLQRDSTSYDIGFEEAKRQMRSVLIEALPKDKRTTPFIELRKDINRGS